MDKYKVIVEKTMYSTGAVPVYADSPNEAIDKVYAMITDGSLQTSHVHWPDPTYEDNSFTTTGDVDDP